MKKDDDAKKRGGGKRGEGGFRREGRRRGEVKNPITQLSVGGVGTKEVPAEEKERRAHNAVPLLPNIFGVPYWR